MVFTTILSYKNSYDPTLNTSLLSLLCFVSHMLYPSRLPWKALTLLLGLWRSVLGGHSFVSGGYVLAKEGMGKVYNAPEGMGKVFSLTFERLRSSQNRSNSVLLSMAMMETGLSA